MQRVFVSMQHFKGNQDAFLHHNCLHAQGHRIKPKQTTHQSIPYFKLLF